MNKVISFSLWGDNPKYTIGAIKNAELSKTIYPDWGFGKQDDIHKKNHQDLNYDINLYNKRKKINFEL